MIKKEFKNDTFNLRCGKIHSYYCKEGKILFSNNRAFELLDDDMKDLYYRHFSKILTGTLDSKIFELDFVGEEGQNTQTTLKEILDGNEEALERFVNKIIKTKYSTDIVVTLLEAHYIEPVKKSRRINKDGKMATLLNHNFILCTIDRIEPREKEIEINMKERELETSSSVEMVLNLRNPINSFMFPSVTDNHSDVDKVLYSSPKSNSLDKSFVTKILNCDIKITIEEEKELFSNLLHISLGKTIKPEIMYEIYKDIFIKVQETGETEFSSKTLEKVLLENKLCPEESVNDISKFLEEEYGASSLDFKLEHVIPIKNKAIKIKTNDMDCAISMSKLNNMKQIEKDNKKFLLIEVNEDLKLEGFNMEVDKQK